jgi:hypothetical protein
MTAMEWIIIIGKLIAVVTGLVAITAGLLKVSRYDKWARVHKSELNSIPAIYARGNAFGISRAIPAGGRDIAIVLVAFGLLLVLILIAVAWGPFGNASNAALMILGGGLALMACLRLGSR